MDPITAILEDCTPPQEAPQVLDFSYGCYERLSKFIFLMFYQKLTYSYLENVNGKSFDRIATINKKFIDLYAKHYQKKDDGAAQIGKKKGAVTAKPGQKKGTVTAKPEQKKDD